MCRGKIVSVASTVTPLVAHHCICTCITMAHAASTCAAFFTSYTQGSDSFCEYPCKASEYLYNNGTCQLWCHPHFDAVTYSNDHFCNYPCMSTEYLYQNGSCLTSCESLFVVRVYSSEQVL